MIRKFQYNKNPDISGYYTVRDANKLSAIWAYLGRFKSVEYAREVLANQITNHTGLIDKKAEQIAYTLRQAEQYFISARNADISIKPLLIYYGIVGLAKVLIISGDNEYKLQTTNVDEGHEQHGLSWKASASNQDEIDVRDSIGLIGEFCHVKEKGLYPLFRSCYCEISIPKNQKIEMKQLLSLIGENWKKYRDFFNETPNIYGARGVSHGGLRQLRDGKQHAIFDDYFHIVHQGAPGAVPQVLEGLFPELNSLYEPTPSRGYASKNDVTSLDSHIVFSKTEGNENFALIQPFSDFKLTDFDIYFLLFFILGSLARYRQDKWHKITQRLSEKDEFFLIENLFGIVQLRFPLLILRELEQKNYEFVGEPALWG